MPANSLPICAISPILWATLFTLFLTGCQQENESPAGSSQAAPPPMPVTAAEVLVETISNWTVFTGRLEAPEVVEVRPRVSGYIEEVHFEEGSLVEKGAPLFSIDARSYQAEVTRLEAEIKSAQARTRLARSDLSRAQRLRQQGAIAEEQAESRRADLSQAQANQEALIAATEAAKLNVSFTEVMAPIAGQVSRAEVTAGNYVLAGQTALTTLVSTDRIHAYFDADERTYLRYQQALAAGDTDPVEAVQMQLANEDGYPHTGKIDFVDNRLNPLTGTIRVRAVFDNSQGLFTPGLFARLRVVDARKYEAVMIDERAILTDLNNKYVLVIGENNTLEYRRILLGPKYQGLRVVQEGLQAGDTIVVKGLQRVYPGSPVQPEMAPMASPEALEKLRSAYRPPATPAPTSARG